jgi:secreted Zn-dependent insulinase-like peptidase
VDQTFGLPKADILLRVVTPMAYQTPAATLLSSLYAQVLQEALNEFAYNSQVAGLSYRFGHQTHTRSAFRFALLVLSLFIVLFFSFHLFFLTPMFSSVSS